MERCALDEHISPAEAAVTLIQDGLNATLRKPASRTLSEADWQRLREDPTVAFFERLPDHVFD